MSLSNLSHIPGDPRTVGWVGEEKIWQKLWTPRFLPFLVPPATTNSSCPWVSKEAGGMKKDWQN